MLVNKPKQGFGLRSWRYSAVINDGVVEMAFVELGFNQYSDDDDPYTTSPEHMSSIYNHLLTQTQYSDILIL